MSAREEADLICERLASTPQGHPRAVEVMGECLFDLARIVAGRSIGEAFRVPDLAPEGAQGAERVAGGESGLALQAVGWTDAERKAVKQGIDRGTSTFGVGYIETVALEAAVDKALEALAPFVADRLRAALDGSQS